MKLALDNDNPVPISGINTFVDGAAVGIPGKRTFQILKNVLNELVLVPEGMVCSGILELYNSESIVVEPAGAITVAALNFYKEEIKGKNIICVLSGSNNDLTRMTEIKQLSNIQKGILHYLLIDFYKNPRAIKQFLTECLCELDEVISVQYTKPQNIEKSPAFVGIECNRTENFEIIKTRMKERDISFNPVNPGD